MIDRPLSWLERNIQRKIEVMLLYLFLSVLEGQGEALEMRNVSYNKVASLFFPSPASVCTINCRSIRYYFSVAPVLQPQLHFRRVHTDDGTGHSRLCTELSFFENTQTTLGPIGGGSFAAAFSSLSFLCFLSATTYFSPTEHSQRFMGPSSQQTFICHFLSFG